jgi:probable selenium-dependent hydroxylase accessory protein YqeC
MDYLKDIFELCQNDIVSIVGSGGKTTLMFKIGNELRYQYKVLLSTSAKIMVPRRECYEHIYTCLDDYKKDRLNVDKGITILSKTVDYERNKLIGIDDYDLQCVADDYYVVVIEADGSRRLPLKGWKSHEPVVLNMTNKTIGVIPGDMLDKRINRDNIYGFEEFKDFLGSEDVFNNVVVGRICSSEVGIFKNSKGKRYLFINKIDDEKDLKRVIELAKYLDEFIKNKPFDFKICYGSLKKGLYYEY